MLPHILQLGNTLLDKFVSDPRTRQEAKLALLEQQQQGTLQELELSLSAIIREAQSNDPWTSRARPSFLYVIYAIILAALPMGVIHAIHPDTASAITQGVSAWLAAIPESLWTLFGIGYLGYAGARSWDKKSQG